MCFPSSSLLGRFSSRLVVYADLSADVVDLRLDPGLFVLYWDEAFFLHSIRPKSIPR